MKKGSLAAALHSWMKANEKMGISLLQKLVQAKSTSGHEREVQQIVIEQLENIGFDVDVWEPDGKELEKHPLFSSARKDFTNSPNVVGVLKGKGNGRSIVLNGHVDVVPEGDLSKWDHPPYSGKIIDGKLYGRGSTDMKGGNVSLLLAVRAIKELGIKLKGDIIFHSVIEEESGGSGTLAAVLKGYGGDGAIIPEPTNMKIFPKQQGSIWFRIKVKGQSAHGGTRYEGVSAIEKSLIVLQEIGRLEQKRNKNVRGKLYENIPIPFPINVGKIYGGDWPSSVPDLVHIEGRLGISPDETVDEAKNDMVNCLEQLKNTDPWFIKNPVSIEWFGARWLPGSIEMDHPLMDMIISNYKLVLKKDPVIEASPWGTDGGMLKEAGNIPVIVFGPGQTEMAHYSNEYIEIKKVFEAAEIIALTVVDWCGAAEQ